MTNIELDNYEALAQFSEPHFDGMKKAFLDPEMQEQLKDDLLWDDMYEDDEKNDAQIDNQFYPY